MYCDLTVSAEISSNGLAMTYFGGLKFGRQVSSQPQIRGGKLLYFKVSSLLKSDIIISIAYIFVIKTLVIASPSYVRKDCGET